MQLSSSRTSLAMRFILNELYLLKMFPHFEAQLSGHSSDLKWF